MNSFELSPMEVEYLATDIRHRAIDDFGRRPHGSDEVRKFLDHIVRSMNGTVHTAPDIDHSLMSVGTIVKPHLKSFEIYVSPLSSPLGDNFRIAHELGHLFLHYENSPDELIFSRNCGSKKSLLANRFAAALLLPAAEVIAARDAGLDIYGIAGAFGVSSGPASVRLSYVDKI